MLNERILLSHGAGGGASQRLLDELFFHILGNEYLLQKNDAVVLPSVQGRIALSTDSFVVQPLFFRGGNIGKLAVCGTVNDLAVQGATPLYLTLGLIIEEGFLMADLLKIVESIAETCAAAGVKIVAGDTKVVNKGQADGLYINTTGIGVVPEGRNISGSLAMPGDVVIINGTIGEHGMAIMSERSGISWETDLMSDCAPLNGLIERILTATEEVHVMRDPTRGGVATTLNEIAAQSGVGIRLNETDLPITDGVRGACEMLGFDPLYVANEGKVLVIVPQSQAEKVLSAMHDHPLGRQAVIIGEVIADHPGLVTLRTGFGGERILDMLEGELLPRIC
ncbi:MAG: hydrogenase expression/formation protein HypE [Firmicutes bacterium]|nr:hydrogenase expression/formation protein HypE [Bacillota bacterium]